jgi:outer membrane lipoprotein-sorting protein
MKRHYMKFIWIIIPVFAGGFQSGPDVEAVIRTIDELYRSQSSYARLQMTIETPHWKRSLEMQAWTSGREKTLIRITAPEKEKGVGTLRVGKEMWNYLPRANKVIKIPSSMMMSSWMGSDFNNNDLVREFTFADDYTFSLTEETPDSLVIRCIPKSGRPIVWGSVRLVVRPDDYLPLRQVYYDEHDRIKRIINYSSIRTFDGRKLPAVMELTPLDEEGHRTVLKYETIDFNMDAAENLFTLRNLRTPEQ